MSAETYSTDGLECPFCGKLDQDAYELGDGGEGCGETECGYCERPFFWSRKVSVSYTARAITKPKTEVAK